MRFSLAVAVIQMSACVVSEGVQYESLATRKGEDTRLLGAREDLYVKGSEISLKWVSVEAPSEGGYDLRFEGVETVAVFTKRGRYVLDRWIEIDLSSAWTHRYTIDVVNSPPRASISGPVLGAIGESIVFDAAASFDLDGDRLQYRWTLVARPGGSTVMLSDVESVTVELVADELGRYTIQLDVFDGEDWSAVAERVVLIR